MTGAASPEPRESLVQAQVHRLLLQQYGVSGSLARLPGENLNYLAVCGDDKYVLKIAPQQRNNDEVDLEHQAAEHIAASALSVRVPRTVTTRDGRVVAELAIDSETILRARLLRFVPGRPWCEVDQHSDELLDHLGCTLAELDLELSGFRHPAMYRTHAWDLTALPQHRDKVSLVEHRKRRQILEWAFHFCLAEQKLRSCGLPCSFIHSDVNDENLLVEGDRIVGLLDFGDCLHNPVVCGLAIALAYVMLDRDDPLSFGFRVVTAYRRVRPLTEDEQWSLFPLVCGRLANTVAMAAERRALDPNHPNWFVTERRAWELLERLSEVDPVEAGVRLGADAGPAVGAPPEKLLEKRRKYIGPSLSLAYREPLKMVRGYGQFLFDHRGRAYLDLVNNICHVGHCHPHVVAAGQRQMAILNTNTRYLYDGLMEYAARLCSTLPQELNTCFFVNSGSEANELALRLARTHTGRQDFLVVDSAYHGNTGRLINISPYKFMGPGGSQRVEPWVHLVPTADGYRGDHKGQGKEAGIAYGNEVGSAADESQQPVAAFITESIWSCGGQVVPPEGYLETAFEQVRQRGGLCIIDEVQVGFGRVGRAFWGFELQGVVPDIVVMGKPMGNGHPMAAVITTEEIATSFNTGMEFFSSFGGNPVSCAIGMAVLDVIEDESLQEHAAALGGYFQEGLRNLSEPHEIIGDVRGEGLFIGVELVKDRGSLEPATEEARTIVNNMKDLGVLMSTDGPLDNVLKIKPPMVVTRADLDMTLRCLDDVLRAF